MPAMRQASTQPVISPHHNVRPDSEREFIMNQQADLPPVEQAEANHPTTGDQLAPNPTTHTANPASVSSPDSANGIAESAALPAQDTSPISSAVPPANAEPTVDPAPEG